MSLLFFLKNEQEEKTTENTRKTMVKYWLNLDPLSLLKHIYLIVIDVKVKSNNPKRIMKKNEVIHYIIRVPKKESAFVYFQLEANEGLCFYSTKKNSLGQEYRDIDIRGDIKLKKQIDQVLNSLIEPCKIEFISS